MDPVTLLGGLFVGGLGMASLARYIRTSPTSWFTGARPPGARATDERVRRTLVEVLEHGHEGKVAGRVHLLKNALIAPLGGHRCAAYALAVERYDARQWRVIASRVEATEFMLDDGSGLARIAVDARPFVDLTMVGRLVVRGEKVFEDRRATKALNLLGLHLVRGTRVRIVEHSLAEGAWAAAHGRAIRAPNATVYDETEDFREPAHSVVMLTLRPPREGSMLVSDDRVRWR